LADGLAEQGARKLITSSRTPSLRERLIWYARNPAFWQGMMGIFLFYAIWQVARVSGLMSVLPGPIEVARALALQIGQPNYWESWLASLFRVFAGFFLAAVVAVPMGIAIGLRKKVRYMWFPILEIFRPIPPIAWLPLAILFWPSPELTMVFLTFMGAFFPIFLNVLAGIRGIDTRFIDAALSLGSSPSAMFWRILVPGALPSLFTGFAVAVGITWNVVIAAEMAAGKGGLGYLTWDAYMNQSLVGIVVGMLSIGIAGIISSALMAWIAKRAMPWRKA
jgi:sulfonate transport system permease protein